MSPTSGSTGDLLTITGTGFGSVIGYNWIFSCLNRLVEFQHKFTGDVTVTIGGSGCVISAVSDTSISCNIGANPAGSYSVIVLINGKGFANKDITFLYNLVLSSLSSTEGYS